MIREVKMTPLAQQATWTKTTLGDHVPTKFLIEGDTKEGYTVSMVNDDLCGFDLFEHPMERLTVVMNAIKEINDTGFCRTFEGRRDRHGRQILRTGAFAWRSYPMPKQETKQLSLEV